MCKERESGLNGYVPLRLLAEKKEEKQGCALAEPGGPWRLTFALGRLKKSQIFHTNHMLGTLDFTVSEHWAPFNFP